MVLDWNCCTMRSWNLGSTCFYNFSTLKGEKKRGETVFVSPPFSTLIQ